MPEDWSPEEVSATVADYFVMLDHELRGEAYSKREHNRRLQPHLRDRSAGAIEFKHANISAVLIEVGLPYIDGDKPRANYQELLMSEVIARLERAPGIIAATQALVEAPVVGLPAIDTFEDVFVPPPIRERERRLTYERRQPSASTPRRINYLEREARNASLGRAGEEFVLEVEHRRLWEAGQRQLAERVDHVSHTRGDGLGYDILSFETDGRERLIEVKTTAFGSMMPFFASVKEVAISEETASLYHLYRLFRFRDAPRIFTLQGSLRHSCVLEPVQFRA